VQLAAVALHEGGEGGLVAGLGGGDERIVVGIGHRSLCIPRRGGRRVGHVP
jgi:hypothetical protein